MERMAQKMKKYRLMNNSGLKIIAFVFAAFLWLIVVNLDNPIESRTFTDVTVKIENDDIITSAGDVYEVVGETTVNVVVYASRQVKQELTQDDIVATADIREMDTSTGLVPIKISIPKYEDDYESAEASPRNLQIQREKSGKKVFSLTVSTGGTQPRDGYMLGELEVNPEKVTITGAESTLDQIDRAVARIKVTGISKSQELDAVLELYDANGNVLGQTQLENNLGDEGITVYVEVLKMKSVPVVFGVTGTPAEGYQYTGISSEPETVQICGNAEDIDNVNEINVPSSLINVDGTSQNFEKTIDITSYLPEGVQLVDENSRNVIAHVMIEKEGTRTIDLLVSSIKINNLAEGLQVSYKPDAEVTLYFSGDEKLLKTLDISNAVSVDLKDYTEPGKYQVPVDVSLTDGISLTENVTVELTISNKDSDSQDENSQEDDSENEETTNDSDAVQNTE